ncbi:putative Poly(A) polymerase beta [Hibiscus syriacus]|uniref:Poly(A) polymerase beta n=1 Tax=Hibiscus syriacus TaxID=106335 RepID=A0A6A2ZAM3_HIBSY|nr:putative Poly(A) polymerase beta [Hibiscus syriacus]
MPCHRPVNGLTAGVAHRLRSNICDLTNLTYLDLYNNSIPGEFPILYNCSRLEILVLSQNYFVGPIPDDIDRLSTLVYLDLSGNNFSGDIPSSIGRLPVLNTLNIVQNQFNGTFPKEIGNLLNLEVLIMAYNEFFPMRIPPEFGRMSKLRYLWMTQTSLIGEIPESFDNLSSLEHLNMALNNPEGHIPSSLFSLKNLTIVYLFHNKLLHSRGLREVATFGVLNLVYNQLTAELPTSIARLPDLYDFRVFRNKFSGVLASEFGLYSKLEGFEVSENQFSGQLPEHLCAGGVLQGVIAYIKISPDEYLCHSEIAPRDAQFNFTTISSPLPSRVTWKMSRVEISNKKFSGEIPPAIASWSNLVVFQASNNLFSGKIPKEFETTGGKIIQYLATWKLTSFQRLGFTKGNILSHLTDNNLIGSGGSGKVYRITINRSGESVAVKKIWNMKLICCISCEDSKLLVYEYMENRSLDRWLHGNKRSLSSGLNSVHHAVLDWPRRLQIAVGVAQGLCYMHHECHAPIIRRDVKHASAHSMSTVAGPFGYLAAEYAYTTKVNAKVDVYSFGVHFSEDKSIVEILDPEFRISFVAVVFLMVMQPKRCEVTSMCLHFLAETSLIFPSGYKKSKKGTKGDDNMISIV